MIECYSKSIDGFVNSLKTGAIHWANLIDEYTLCGINANQIHGSELAWGDRDKVTCPRCKEIMQLEEIQECPPLQK